MRAGNVLITTLLALPLTGPALAEKPADTAQGQG